MRLPRPAAARTDVFARFWRSVRHENGCWIWQLSTDKDGYGQFRVRDRVVRVHRFARAQLVGDTPLHLDHTCNRRRCVKPGHLEPVTHLENCRRRDRRRQHGR